MKDNTQNNSLDTFEGWETPTSQEDFFSTLDSEDNDDTDVTSVIKKATEDEDDEEEAGDTKEPVDLFEEIERDPDQSSDVEILEEDEDDEEEEEEEITTKNISALNYLSSKGLIEYELEEGAELTEELAEQLIEDNYEKKIESTVEELFQDMPDFVKQLNKFVIKGGDPRIFLQNVSQGASGTITDSLDIDEEANQELVVREILAQQGEDAETIDTQIEFLKDSKKLKTYSEKKYNKWKEDNKKIQDQMVLDQAEQVRVQKQKIKEAKTKASEFFETTQEINGLTFSEEDKKQLPSYMNDKSVKLQNGTSITAMQKELFYDLPTNEKAMAQLATLMKNRNEDGTFNFDSISNSTKTKVIKEVKENVRRSKTSIPNKSKKGTKQPKRSLASFFDN